VPRYHSGWGVRGSARLALAALACGLIVIAGSSRALSAQQVLLGDQTIEATVDSDSAGKAEAFRTNATAAGSVSALVVYVNSTVSASTVFAGLYSASGSHPGTLLSQGRLAAPAKGAWNTIPLNTAVAVTAGTTYWIALLSPNGGGTIAFRDIANGGASETSLQTTLGALPSTWSTGAIYKDGPLSAYGVAGQLTPDTTPPSTPTSLHLTATTANSLAVAWTASTDNVGVTGYDALLNSVRKGTSASTTYTYSGLACGTTYTLAVDAYDAAANTSPQASITATTSACADTTPPTTPGNLVQSGSTRTSANVSWTASSDNTAVAGYTVYLSGTSTGTTTATSAMLSNLACGSTYAVDVDAYDASGNHSAPAHVSVITNACDTTAPSVRVTMPAGGSTVTGSVSLSADALDDTSVAAVQFQVDGTNVGQAVTSSPYSITWASTNVGNGNHTVTAVARDGSGNAATSLPVTITVFNDVTPPSAAVTAPADRSTVTGTTSLTATASDDTGVVGVQFKLDGTNLGSEVTTAPYSLSWDTTKSTDGAHTLTAVARDAAGNTGTSPAITVTVSNGTVDTSHTFQRVPVGNGLAEATTREVVRTSGNRVYAFVDDDTAQRLNAGPGVIRAYRATTAGNPTAFAEADAGHHPTSTGSSHVLYGPDVRLDRSGVAHLVYVDQLNGNLYYQTFSTVTDTWGTRQQLATGSPSNTGFYSTPNRVYRSWTTYNILLDNNDAPAVVYSSGNTLYYVSKAGGTWSSPKAIAVGTSPIHPVLAADAAFDIYAAWLDSPSTEDRQLPQYCGSSIKYARLDASTGIWSAPETIDSGCPNVLSNQTCDQGPSIVLNGSNQAVVEYLSGTTNSGGQAISTITIRRRTSSGWVDDSPPSSGYGFTHAPQIYSQGNDLYTALGHDQHIWFGYLYQLSGQAWAPYKMLDNASPADGSASIRWDPQRETNARVIDVLRHGEDKLHNNSFQPELFYYALLPTGDISAPDSSPPTVSVTQPTVGATVTGTSVQVSATAADNVGVSSVQFQVDGANVGARLTAAPYQVTWNTTLYTNGTHTLKAVATDAAGNATTSSGVSVTVSNQTPSDTTPPTVSISTPAANATVSGTINVGASAADNVGVAGVQFLLDGQALGGEVTASPYQVAWGTATAANGTHTLSAVARDAAGNRTTSASVPVTVNNSSQLLFGTQAVQTQPDSDGAGRAEAFKTTATSSGSLAKVGIYVDSGTAASQLIVGVYADAGGHPGTLLTQGAVGAPAPGSWVSLPVSATAITSGTSYWIALLGTGGTLRFRDKAGGGSSESSAQTSLTQLPAQWSTGQTYTDGLLSAYGSS
jgi:chitodextrinase